MEPSVSSLLKLGVFQMQPIVTGTKTPIMLCSLCMLSKENFSETTIFKKIVETLEKHHLPRPSEMVERFKFHSRYRKVDEGVVTYVAASCKLSGHCNYGETLLEMLRDRFVCSVNNEKI